MSSVLEGKICEIDKDSGSEVEGVDRILGYSLDEIMCANAEETWREWRVGMMIFSFAKPCEKLFYFYSKTRKEFSYYPISS